jgi:hypothetical protein
MTIHLRHPYTNQLPIGYLRDGAPIWPVMGGDGTADPTDPKPAADPPAGDPPKPDGPPAEDPSQGARGEPAQPRPSSLTEALRRLPEFGQGVKG